MPWTFEKGSSVTKTAKKRVDWTETAIPGEGEASKRLPRRVGDTRPMPPGSSYVFTEMLGGSDPLVLMTAKLPKALTRPIKVALPSDFRAAIEEATLGVQSLAALVALADYALDRLEALKPVELRIEPRFDDSGRWTDCVITSKRSDTLAVVMEGSFAKGAQRRGQPDGRTQIPVPDDVSSRIQALSEDGSAFSGVVLGLAWWSVLDLRRRKKRLVIGRAQ